MAENVPPNTTTANSAAADTATRGLPYYEKLKRDLRETLNKKRQLDRTMASLEEQIYRYEGSYLEETAAGNIIKGFDNYIKGSTTGGTGTNTGGGGTATRRKGTVMEHDRVFSRSSVSFLRDTPPPSSTQTTPSHAPTPVANATVPSSARESNHPTPGSSTSTPRVNPTLKKSKKADEEESEGKQPKRLKITYARGEKGGGE